jgi:NADPH:quinone reductase-like Zn-dependent oxidoreductase
MTDRKMRAVQIDDYGGPEVLKLVEQPIPEPGEGQALIRVHAAGVNSADWKARSGMMRHFRPLTFPWTPGLEAAGIIEAVGPGVPQSRQKLAVYGPVSGAYAEYTLASLVDIQPKPDRLTFEEAAAVPIGALTAWGSVFDTARVQPGQRVLIQGAAGGVGLFAVQMASWKGAQVFGTASSQNIEFVRTLGAEAIDYTAGPFEDQVSDMDVVIDTVGGDVLQRSLRVLRRGGILVTIAGQLSPDSGKDRGIRVQRGGRAPVEKLKEIGKLIDEGKLTPIVEKVFPLSEARQAQELSQTGHGRGRIVLHVSD